jgi:hypothetical protein
MRLNGATTGRFLIAHGCRSVKAPGRRVRGGGARTASGSTLDMRMRDSSTTKGQIERRGD